jgi:hypothetical protein
MADENTNAAARIQETLVFIDTSEANISAERAGGAAKATRTRVQIF